MQIDDKTIDRLAKLSALYIEDDKKQSLQNELAEIVNFVENLNEIDVSKVEATFTTIEGGQPFREDKIDFNKEISTHIINHAPKVEDNCFVVPAIIE